MTMAPWPNGHPFEASVRDSVGDNAPDFPGSQGGREMGKFRPSHTPKLVQVAVCDDAGNPIGTAFVPDLAEIVFWLRAIYLGSVASDLIEDVVETATDV